MEISFQGRRSEDEGLLERGKSDKGTESKVIRRGFFSEPGEEEESSFFRLVQSSSIVLFVRDIFKFGGVYVFNLNLKFIYQIYKPERLQRNLVI